MKALLLILGFIASLQLATALDPAPARVIFSNDDELSGSLSEIVGDHLLFNSPLLARATPFYIDAIQEIQLTPEAISPEASHQATVFLTNGDQIQGQLLHVSPDTIELASSLGTHLRLNRLMISQVKISESRKPIYRGPSGLAEWIQDSKKPAWTFANATFQSFGSGSIARNVEFPSECRVAFDISTQGTFSLILNLFATDITKDRPTTGYALSFRQHTVSLKNTKTLKVIGQTRDAGAIQENAKTRVEICLSSKTGEISLLLDQELIKTWADPELRTAQLGKGLHFIAAEESKVEISKIEVSPWDPELDPLPDPQDMEANQPIPVDEDSDKPKIPDAPAPPSDRIELRNGDSLVGEVLSIQDQQILLKTPFSEVTLPLHALRNLVLKPVPLERCKREKGDVRVSAPDGTSFVFRLMGLKDDQLSGTSQNFGEATFSLSAFDRIEFNIYPRSREELSKEER
jgi:hypothetical protein